MRSSSFAGGQPAPTDPAFEHIHEPGGFRRNYVLLQASKQGTEEPRILNNFIDFLFIFGHFVSLPLYAPSDVVLDIVLRRVRISKKTRMMTGLRTKRRAKKSLLQRCEAMLLRNLPSANLCWVPLSCQGQGHVRGADVCPSLRTGMPLSPKQC